MTPLARGAEIHPGGVVGPRRRRVAVVLLADVTADAVLVPLLDRVGVPCVGPDDVDVVEPLPSQHIPGRGQDDDAPAIDGGQVVLNPAVAERVVDAVLDGLAGERRLGDVERAVRRPQAIRLAVQRQPRLGEVAQGGLGPGRLDHPAVAAALPGLVLVAVTGRAGRGADGDGLATDRAGSRADRGGPRALRPDRSWSSTARARPRRGTPVVTWAEPVKTGRILRVGGTSVNPSDPAFVIRPMTHVTDCLAHWRAED